MTEDGSMSFFSALYTLLIGPLELFFEVLFSTVNRVVNNPGLSIIFLSLAMNFLVLPLYKMSDAMQAEEAATEARLKPTVSHIKKTFKGDERFMILQMYYKENHYKPSDALKGSVSLLLEIPFFMAAYNFLSGLSILHGASLGPIANLAAPDAMLAIGGMTINVLPILMTFINLVSSAIYTKGASTRSKVQLYVMAGLFLVLLYDSPSGLVFYWTLNNLFSLVKNVFMKLKNPKKVFCGLCSFAGLAALIFVVSTRPMPTVRSQLLLGGLALALQLPLAVCLISKHIPRTSIAVPGKNDGKTFWIAGLFLTVLTGLFIPSGVISASPEEFVNAVTHTNPLIYILNATLIAAGFFLIWFGVFYLLAKGRGRKWMSCGMSVFCILSIVNFMFFGQDYGNMSANLIFDMTPMFTQKLLNLGIIGILTVIICFIWFKKQVLIRFAALAAALTAVLISILNIGQITKIVSQTADQLVDTHAELPVIPLSRSGKNVVVLMLDRGVGAYVPFLMEEKPELREQFDGFTYFPNTLSFGPATNIGAPALFGGYEYTPEELNKRDQELLMDKHDEALKMMPVAFWKQDYEVSVFDPPCAGYQWIPDLSIFSEYPDIHTYNSMRMANVQTEASAAKTDAHRNRNFFCYSVMKCSPVVLRGFLYNEGKYNDLDASVQQQLEGLSRAEGENEFFLQTYAVLDHLPEMTRISDTNKQSFLMLTNDTTHTPTLLQLPAYEPASSVDNLAYDASHPNRLDAEGNVLKMETASQVTHYHVNMASFLKLGEWFDFLRDNGVYNNTRIIIVADHGFRLHQIDGLLLNAEAERDVLNFNPMLLVKDFGATGFRTDRRFMTNADTPLLAMSDLIPDMKNPFTGNTIGNEHKTAHPQYVLAKAPFDMLTDNKPAFPEGMWYAVHDNIFDLNNWEYLGTK